MSLTLADQYYLKALDNYYYDLPEAIENLNYALSYNKDHTNANCLMGRVYSELLKNPELAIHYFEQALVTDLKNIEVISHYSNFLIDQREYEKAKKMLEYGFTIKGINKGMFLYYKALIEEYQQNYKKAKKILKLALVEVFSEKETNFIKDELSRVKEKIKRLKAEKTKTKTKCNCNCKCKNNKKKKSKKKK